MLGDLETGAGNRAAALGHYRAVVEKDGSNAVALNNLAYQLAKDDPDAALTYAQRAVERLPDTAEVQDTLGWIYYRKGLYTMATSHLAKAVAYAATPLRKYHLGLAKLKNGDREQGQRLLQAALEADPTLAKTEW
jgi:tetratricopeptide (TPR) repeat protein